LYSTNYPIIDPSSRISEDFCWFFLDRIVSKKKYALVVADDSSSAAQMEAFRVYLNATLPNDLQE